MRRSATRLAALLAASAVLLAGCGEPDDGWSAEEIGNAEYVLAALHADKRASEVARRRVARGPWQEQAHQDLMRVLALSGQRGAALAQSGYCEATALRYIPYCSREAAR